MSLSSSDVSLDSGIGHFFQSVLPAALDHKDIDKTKLQEMFRYLVFATIIGLRHCKFPPKSWSDFCDEASAADDDDFVCQQPHMDLLLLHLANNPRLSRKVLEEALVMGDKRRGFVDIDARQAARERVKIR